jgi:hypothetical protein
MAEPQVSSEDRRIANFLKGFLSGTVEVGISLIPLISLYKNQKGSGDWKYHGLKEWLTSDPEASEQLVRVLATTKDQIPESARSAMILALGGVPV